MLKRLKEAIYTDQIQKTLIEAKVDGKHDRIIFSRLSSIIRSLTNSKTTKQTSSAILKKINSKNYVTRLKGLIVAHYLIKKTKCRELIEYFIELNGKNFQNTLVTEGALISDLREYVEDYIIGFYERYLMKFCLNFDCYEFAKHFESKNTNTIDTINHGFQSINLMNIVLKTQQSFCKMGRYYGSHFEIINLFMMYLDDMSIFNNFIKMVSKNLLSDAKSQSSEQVKHNFLFMTQAQKTSDRLYQFFYNRYFYNTIKDIIFFPTFLSIPNQEFEQLRKKVRQVDKNLLSLVSCSTTTDTTLKTEHMMGSKRGKNKLETSIQCCSTTEVNMKGPRHSINNIKYNFDDNI